MEAHLERVEVEPLLRRDDDLAIDDRALGQGGPERREKLGKVTLEGLQIATLEVYALAIAEHDCPKPVPLRLEEPPVAVRQLVGELRQHRLDRRLQHHRGRRAAMRPSADAHPASKGCPGSSRSSASGVWSEGVGFPLRGSRSISVQTTRAATGGDTSRWSMRMP